MNKNFSLIKKIKNSINFHDYNSGKYTFRLISNYIEKNSLNINNILEVGCGYGFGSLLLSLKYPHKKFYCLDNAMYRNLKFEIYSDEKYLKNITFFNSELKDFKTLIKFDLIFTIDVIEHVLNPKNFFNDLLKLKMKKTHILIHYPNTLIFDIHFMIPVKLFLNNKKIINFIFKKKINFVERKHNCHGYFKSLNFINYFKMLKICKSFDVTFYFNKNINSFYLDNYMKNNKIKNSKKLFIKLIKKIDHRFNLFNLLILN